MGARLSSTGSTNSSPSTSVGSRRRAPAPSPANSATLSTQARSTCQRSAGMPRLTLNMFRTTRCVAHTTQHTLLSIKQQQQQNDNDQPPLPPPPPRARAFPHALPYASAFTHPCAFMIPTTDHPRLLWKGRGRQKGARAAAHSRQVPGQP